MVSADRLWSDVQYLASLDRTSGQPGESRAVDYIISELAAAGVEAHVLEFDSYLSYPGPASLTAAAGGGRAWSIECITHSFAAPTPPGGIKAELAWVGDGDASDYEGKDVAGKIVMFGGYKGLVMPERVRRAEERGAAAVICVNYGEILHEMIVTTVWGTPTLDNAGDVPRVPVVSVKRSDGERLISALNASELVSLHLTAQVDTGWRRLRIPVAEIPGTTPRFFLAAGHLDSWYVGVTDNATGDALLLELARVFAAARDDLQRGLRIAWWPGHSTGRYSGSAYYAETAWADLDANCVGLTIVDSPGVRGATVQRVRTMAEARQFNIQALESLGCGRPNLLRPERVGDQSFLGIGITAMSHNSELAADHAERFPVGGSGGGWWWHNAADTLDKADPEVLRNDTSVYAHIIGRILGDALLPYDFAATALQIAGSLSDWQARSAGLMDCQDLIDAAERLAADIETWQTRCVQGAISPDAAEQAALNLARALNPVLYTVSGRFGQDPAASQPLLPGLALAAELPALKDADPDGFGFARTTLRRELNRLAHAIATARHVIGCG